MTRSLPLNADILIHVFVHIIYQDFRQGLWLLEVLVVSGGGLE